MDKGMFTSRVWSLVDISESRFRYPCYGMFQKVLGPLGGEDVWYPCCKLNAINQLSGGACHFLLANHGYIRYVRQHDVAHLPSSI